MHDDSMPTAPKRSSRRARVDAAPAGQAEAGPEAPPPLNEARSRDRLAAAVAAVAAIDRGTAKPVKEADGGAPPSPRRRSPEAAPKPVWIERSPKPRRTSYLVQAAAIAVSVGLGWAAASRIPASAPAATPQSVQALADDLLRLRGDLGSLRGGIEAVKGGMEHARQETQARLQQWGERLASYSPPQSDTGLEPKLSALTQRMERLEAPERDRELQARLVQLQERLDKAERQLAARAAAATPAPIPSQAAAAPPTASPQVTAAQAATPQAAPPLATPQPAAPDQTGSITEKAKPTLDRWALRDVYNGLALVEGPSGGLMEIGPGQALPGAGRVEAIERRGRAWVVVTQRGLITTQPW